MLKYMNPSCAEFLYCDTDSVHVLCKYPVLMDNIDTEFRLTVQEQIHKYFSGYKHSPVYGTLESEGVFKIVKYCTEKVYNKISSDDSNTYLIKGIPERYVDTLDYDQLQKTTFLVGINARTGGGIGIQSQFKTLNFIAFKRYFRDEQHSISYRYPSNERGFHSGNCNHIK